MPHAGGRPTKYSPEILNKTIKYIDGCVKNNSIPFIEQIAFNLDINDETVLEWEKIHPEFSAAIKKIRQLQKLRLLAGSLNNQYNTTACIFQLKANHGLVETSKQDITSNGNTLSGLIQVNESNKPISLADDSKEG